MSEECAAWSPQKCKGAPKSSRATTTPAATVDNGSCTSPFDIVYEDFDGDGIGGDLAIADVCELGPGISLETGDCDDTERQRLSWRPRHLGDGVDNNCDGVVSGDELIPCPADVNSDGQITVADVLLHPLRLRMRHGLRWRRGRRRRRDGGRHLWLVLAVVWPALLIELSSTRADNTLNTKKALAFEPGLFYAPDARGCAEVTRTCPDAWRGRAGRWGCSCRRRRGARTPGSCCRPHLPLGCRR